jgi:hypothetical protein
LLPLLQKVTAKILQCGVIQPLHSQYRPLLLRMSDFPIGTTPSKQGNLGVRYFAENSTSIFLSGNKKIERKPRYVEVASAAGRYYILVYKVKKNSTVPYFKLEILPDTVVKVSDRYSEFRFFLGDEDTAVFDVDDSTVRKDWVDAINAAIDTLNGRPPASPLRRSPSPARGTSARSPSPGGLRLAAPVRSPSAERSRSPQINYAKSGSTRIAESTAASNGLGHEPAHSSQTPRSRVALSVPTDNTRQGHIGMSAPTRRSQRHLDNSLALGTTGKPTTPERERVMSEGDLSLALGSSLKAAIFDASLVDSTPFQVRGGLSSPVSPISTMSRAERSHGPFSVGKQGSASADAVIGGDVTSPPRAPGMRSQPQMASPIAPQPAQPAQAVQAPTEGHSGAAGGNVLPSADSADSPEVHDPASQDDHHHHDEDTYDDPTERQLALLQQENHALSAMNDDLNEALERTEALLRSSEEDHLYQMAHMQAQLEHALTEPAQLKAELADLHEEYDSLKHTFADQHHELELNRSEIRDLKEELAASQSVILGLHETITEYEVKYSARNVDRIAQLETALDKTHSILSERDAEVEELTNQLDAYRKIIREKELALRNDPVNTKSAELTARRLEMQREIDVLRNQLDRKDEEFVSGLSDAMESQIKAKMVPLNQSTRKLTMDLAASHAAEEAERVSKVRLESLVAQQEGYIEQLNLQVDGLRAELARAAETAQELPLYKDDARTAAQQREAALKERDELARRLTSLERELATQREAFLAQLEMAQTEISKQKAHVSKVGIEDSHLVRLVALFACAHVS